MFLSELGNDDDEPDAVIHHHHFIHNGDSSSSSSSGDGWENDGHKTTGPQSCQRGTDCGMCSSFDINIISYIYSCSYSCFNVIVILSTGNGRGSQWKCRDGYCEPRSEFEMEMEQVTE